MSWSARRRRSCKVARTRGSLCAKRGWAALIANTHPHCKLNELAQARPTVQVRDSLTPTWLCTNHPGQSSFGRVLSATIHHGTPGSLERQCIAPLRVVYELDVDVLASLPGLEHDLALCSPAAGGLACPGACRCKSTAYVNRQQHQLFTTGRVAIGELMPTQHKAQGMISTDRGDGRRL